MSNSKIGVITASCVFDRGGELFVVENCVLESEGTPSPSSIPFYSSFIGVVPESTRQVWVDLDTGEITAYPISFHGNFTKLHKITLVDRRDRITLHEGKCNAD